MRSILIAALFVAAAGAVHAGAIRNACMASPKGSPQLCSCIQVAADRTLTKKDQKLAASFFGDPDRAQQIRQSDRRSHEVFWKRYRNFGEAAEAFCS